MDFLQDLELTWLSDPEAPLENLYREFLDEYPEYAERVTKEDVADAIPFLDGSVELYQDWETDHGRIDDVAKAVKDKVSALQAEREASSHDVDMKITDSLPLRISQGGRFLDLADQAISDRIWPVGMCLGNFSKTAQVAIAKRRIRAGDVIAHSDLDITKRKSTHDASFS